VLPFTPKPTVLFPRSESFSSLNLGFGRIVASEIEAPIVLGILYEVDERRYKWTTRPSPAWNHSVSGSSVMAEPRAPLKWSAQPAFAPRSVM
jgi:hypothetical protein